MRKSGHPAGFSLVELLVVVAIIALLAAISLPIYQTAIKHADCAGCLSHMRTLGIAFTSYASDNGGQLPGRFTQQGTDKWPLLLQPYVPSIECYVDPGDPIAVAQTSSNLLSNSHNYSSFFFNGFNDLGAYTNPNITVGLSNMTDMTNLAILGQQKAGSGQFYMDFVEGNQDDIINKSAYFGGANYTFADGSSRFMTQTAYNAYTGNYVDGAGNKVSDGDWMWLVNKGYVIPPIPNGH
jgi:prepilin-type N-terminal cleavage/methylation domain-containing protein/prepilin-type processing-associated H-X9-DG protein